MPRTKASNEAQYRYNAAHLKRVPLDMQKSTYEEIKAHAETRSESVNGFIKRAIFETMERDSGLQEVAKAGEVSLPSETVKIAQEAAQASGETPSQFISRAVEMQTQEDTRVRLNKDRREQTTAALVREIWDTGHLVASMLWCNVAYNSKLYKKPKDAQEVHAALVECKQRICTMLDNLIKTVKPRDDVQKEV